MEAPEVVLLFDGQCGFCTRAAWWLRRVDRGGRVALVPFQQPGAPERFGLTPEACAQAAWAITPDGERHRGAAAILVALAAARGWPWLLALYRRIPLVRCLADALYAGVAAHRGRLPGVRPYCEEHPSACGGTAAGEETTA